MFDIQGGIEPSPQTCAELYGTIVLVRDNERRVLWNRPRDKSAEVCEPNAPLNQGQQSGELRLDGVAEVMVDAAKPWRMEAGVKDADDVGKDGDVLIGTETVNFPGKGQDYLQNSYPKASSGLRASLGYSIDRIVCGRSDADYIGKEYVAQSGVARGSKLTFKSQQNATLKTNKNNVTLRWKILKAPKNFDNLNYPLEMAPMPLLRPECKGKAARVPDILRSSRGDAFKRS
ncbi:hypothetical protein [Nocardia brasiliensis]|uniref:hypothetical protein n=1 Tax=Nocardia brasiliensis TaxID=37326 RepID=UPI002454D551|nr:hypothetical protein [Nocardia brasiliensis]